MAASEKIGCDLLVLGAGMAGLTAAARAAESGLKVIVVEKASAIGGSAALSGGYLWTLPTHRKLAYVDDGEPSLGAVVTDSYRDVLAGCAVRACRWGRRSR